MTQTELILDYLRQYGSITPMEAIDKFGCMRLGARIYDLREQGVKIRRTMARGKNRRGEPVSFARYELEVSENEEELNA